MKFNLLELLIAAFFGVYAGYLSLALVTDLRINQLRPFIIDQGVREGVRAGVAAYETQSVRNQSLLQERREARDKALKEYVKRLDRILEMK